VRLTTHTHAFLGDFRWLVEDVGSRPTEIAEIVPDAIPATKGACDASGHGLGGVNFVPLPNGQTLPMLWRQQWPSSISTRLVSSSNPKGDITNSELEIAATIAQFDVLSQTFDIRSHTIHNLSENSATVAWKRKGAASTAGPVAYLLRLHALHQRHHRYIPLHDFIPGVANVLADQCSRLFHLTDQQLLAHFDVAFPQTMPWQQFPLRSETLSALISALSRKKTRLGITAKRAKAADAHWTRWQKFCLEHNIDPFVRHCQYPVAIIQVFAQRYRDGRIAPKGRSVKSGTVEDAVRAVGQAFAQLGGADIRKDAYGEIDFRITRQFKCYKKEDGPPSRVKPVPIIIILFILHQAYNGEATEDRRAVADMVTIAFYFLLRPGEYTGTTSYDTPFRLQDVKLHIDDRLLYLFNAPIADLHAATTVSLTFTTQKNGTKGEIITHGLSTDPLACPVKSVVRCIIHLRNYKPSKSTPLASYHHNSKRVTIKAEDITESLRLATIATSHQTGLQPADISARSLRAGGAMALLCGRIDHDTIRMLGRWHSDAMMRYLHLQAKPLMRQFAPAMFNHGTYSFLPSDTVPSGDY
jgi:hypothetical protein